MSLLPSSGGYEEYIFSKPLLDPHTWCFSVCSLQNIQLLSVNLTLSCMIYKSFTQGVFIHLKASQIFHLHFFSTYIFEEVGDMSTGGRNALVTFTVVMRDI